MHPPPRSLAPGEDGTVDAGLESQDASRADIQPEDRVCGVVVGVIQAVLHKGHDPEEDIDEWVDEEEAELTSDRDTGDG